MNYNLTKINNYSRLLTTMLSYIICFITVLMVYQKRIPTAHCLLGIPLILLYYYLVQQYCQHSFLYIFLHIILLVPVLLISFSYIEYRYLYLIMLCFENIQAFLAKKRAKDKNSQNIPWYIFIGICLIYMVAFGSDYIGFATLIYYLGIGLIMLHFIRFFIAGLIRLLSGSTETTSIPIKKIILNNTYTFVLFLIVFAILAIAIQHSGLTDSLLALGKMLAKVIGLIFRFLFYVITILKAFFAEESHIEETQEAEQNVEQAFSELQEPTLLATIVEGLFTIACICLFVYCMYLITRTLIKVFAKRYIQDSDTVIQLTKPTETTKETERQASVIEKIKEFFQNDNASKIRRGYRLKINSYKSFSPRKSDTPSELAKEIANNYQDDIDELTKVYEKARYSNEEITFEDIKKGGIL